MRQTATAERRRPQRNEYDGRRTVGDRNRRSFPSDAAGRRPARGQSGADRTSGRRRADVGRPSEKRRFDAGRPPAARPANGVDFREEAAERRRRQAAKRRRKIRRRRRLVFRLLLVAAALFVLPKAGNLFLEASASLITRLARTDKAGGQEHHSGTILPTEKEETGSAAGVSQAPVLAQGGANPGLLRQLQSMYQENPDAADILAHPENYPDALLLLLSKRPETLEFVKNYPEKKSEKVQVDLKGEVTKGVIPLLYQWDLRWGYDRYGDTIVALAGCGPTCLSMVALGLTGDSSLDPGSVAAFSESHGFLTEVGSSWELMTAGAKDLGLTGEELPLDENRMVQALEAGKPIICSMRPGDFTDTGHFIVLTGYENGAFTVHDPNSIDNSQKKWTYERIQGQIRNLWAFSARE